MSNTSSLKPSTKPCFRFAFPNPDAAAKFLDYANRQDSVTNAQHPYDPQKRVEQDLTKVFVNGCGSTIYDVNLQTRLMAAADELGGHFIPRV